MLTDLYQYQSFAISLQQFRVTQLYTFAQVKNVENTKLTTCFEKFPQALPLDCPLHLYEGTQIHYTHTIQQY